MTVRGIVPGCVIECDRLCSAGLCERIRLASHNRRLQAIAGWTFMRSHPQSMPSACISVIRMGYTVVADAMLSGGSSSSSCIIARSSSRFRVSLVLGWKVHSFMEAARILACSCALLLAVSSCTALSCHFRKDMDYFSARAEASRGDSICMGVLYG